MIGLNEDSQKGLLTVRLGRPGEPVDLALLENLAERLRTAFREIVHESTGDLRPKVRLLVRDAKKGSLILTVRPELEGQDLPPVEQVALTLIGDINALGNRNPRPDMSANLLGQYRDLVWLAERAGSLEIGYDGGLSTIGPSNIVEFQAAVREQPEAGVAIVGTIETINIHSKPWTFGLYTKLDRQRVECRFGEDLLDHVLRHLDAKTLILVTGEALFSVVGITPRCLTVMEVPTALEYRPDALRACRRSLSITREGESVSSTVERIRRELTSIG